jgi:glycosyltransferase involved in cell wall biosynthesis
MLHVFSRYRMQGTPFELELQALGVPYRLFCETVNLRYRSAAGLVFGVYPRLVAFAVRQAIASMARARPHPDVAIVGTDVEAVVVGAMRHLFSPRTRLVFETFIMTPRGNRLLNRFYDLYLRLVLSQCALAICHSSLEVSRYRQAFPRTRCRFAFVPFGTAVVARHELIAARPASCDDPAYAPIVSAGRSGRDYLTLAQAVDGLACRLDIICDTAPPTEGVAVGEQIAIRRDCAGTAYIEALSRALFVVVPLSADDISAGQMVLLQAAALERAVIITRTPTTEEYATDEVDALMVDRGDVGQMRRAIRRLLDDPALRRRLAVAARARFERDHSTEGYVRNLVATVRHMLPA